MLRRIDESAKIEAARKAGKYVLINEYPAFSTTGEQIGYNLELEETFDRHEDFKGELFGGRELLYPAYKSGG